MELPRQNVQGVNDLSVKQYIPYPLVVFRYVTVPKKEFDTQCKQTQQRYTLFANLTPEGIQFRAISKADFNNMENLAQTTYDKILEQSIMFDFFQYEQFHSMQKKNLQLKQTVFIIGFFPKSPEIVQSIQNTQQNPPKANPLFVCRFFDQYAMDKFFYEVLALKQASDSQKIFTDYLGIQINTRKIIQKILISCPSKRELYKKLFQKFDQKRITLTSKQNKKFLQKLMGNHPQMQNFIRKQKIQAYQIQKKVYEELMLQQQRKNPNNNKVQVIEGYSEKRRMDGLVRKIPKKQNRQTLNPSAMSQDVLLNAIPQREEYELDEFIGIIKNIEEMQMEKNNIIVSQIAYRAEKLKIPVKEYSLTSKQIISIPKQTVYFNESSQNNSLAIEAVKFMYQLININNQKDQIIDKILDCLKDILTECTYKVDPKNQKIQIQSPSIKQLLKKANINYLQYRKKNTIMI